MNSPLLQVLDCGEAGLLVGGGGGFLEDILAVDDRAERLRSQVVRVGQRNAVDEAGQDRVVARSSVANNIYDMILAILDPSQYYCIVRRSILYYPIWQPVILYCIAKNPIYCQYHNIHNILHVTPANELSLAKRHSNISLLKVVYP